MWGKWFTAATALVVACSAFGSPSDAASDVLDAIIADEIARFEAQLETAETALKAAEAEALARRQVAAALRNAVKDAEARVAKLVPAVDAAARTANQADDRVTAAKRGVERAAAARASAADLRQAARNTTLRARAAYHRGVDEADAAAHAAIVARARAVVAAADSTRRANGQSDPAVDALEQAAEAAEREATKRSRERDALRLESEKLLEALGHRETALMLADGSVEDALDALQETIEASDAARAVADQASVELKAAEIERTVAAAAARDAEAAAKSATSAVADRQAERDRLARVLEAKRDAARLTAILYEEPVDTADADATVTAFIAAVAWRYVADGPNGPEIEADLAVPERNMTIKVSIRSNDDDTLPASHLVEVVVDTPADFPGKAIGSIPRIVLKPTEGARGQPLVGAAAKVADGFFWIALSAADNDISSNLSLMRDRDWIDLPFVYENGQRAILTFEKGPDGEAAFDQAFAAWGAPRETPIASYRISISSGMTSEQIVNCLDAVNLPEGQDLHGVSVEQDLECRTASRLLDGPRPATPPEGSLLPGLYAFDKGDTRTDLLAQMTREFNGALQESWRNRALDLPLKDMRELAILASIVEEESATDDERGRIAAVFANRLRRGMHLQSESALLYGLYGGKGRPEGHVTTGSDLRAETPYNTYTVAGLPPGPVSNPSKASLQAAANPASSQDLYFVADGRGGHVFAETLGQHHRNVVRLRKAARAEDCEGESQSFGGEGIEVTVCHRERNGDRIALVTVRGRLALGDERHFNRALLTVDAPVVVVALNSRGGSVDAGLKIARTIWNNEYATLAKGECFSMCALAWLAGRPRYAAPAAQVGFHAPGLAREEKMEASSVGSALVGGYLQDIGMTRAAIAFLTEPGPEEMRILTLEDATRYGISYGDWQD